MIVRLEKRIVGPFVQTLVVKKKKNRWESSAATVPPIVTVAQRLCYDNPTSSSVLGGVW